MKLLRRTFLHLAAGAAALPAVSRVAWAQTPQWAALSHQSCASHDKAEIGGRNSIRRIGPSGGGS
jgi:hypothetical protein